MEEYGKAQKHWIPRHQKEEDLEDMTEKNNEKPSKILRKNLKLNK